MSMDKVCACVGVRVCGCVYLWVCMTVGWLSPKKPSASASPRRAPRCRGPRLEQGVSSASAFVCATESHTAAPEKEATREIEKTMKEEEEEEEEEYLR